MKNTLAAIVMPQIEMLIAKYEDLQKRTQCSDFSDISTSEANEFVTAGMATIFRTAGAYSQYAKQTVQIIEKLSPYHIHLRIPHVGGALKALYNAIMSVGLYPKLNHRCA